jgi:beta-galactosidase
MGIATDVIDVQQDLSGYRLVIAPLLYMLKPGVCRRLEDFVRGGGVLVTTNWTGIADQDDLCFLGPGPLRSLLGLHLEEVDGLYPEERNRLLPRPGNGLGLRGSYALLRHCGLVRPESARVLAVYGLDFYKGRPALTVNAFGQGQVFHLAADAEDRFLLHFYRSLARRLGLRGAAGRPLPEGVSAQVRSAGAEKYLFLLNFARRPRAVRLASGAWTDAFDGKAVPGRLTLPAFGYRVCKGKMRQPQVRAQIAR